MRYVYWRNKQWTIWIICLQSKLSKQRKPMVALGLLHKRWWTFQYNLIYIQTVTISERWKNRVWRAECSSTWTTIIRMFLMWMLTKCEITFKRRVALSWQQHMDKYTARLFPFGHAYRVLTIRLLFVWCHELGMIYTYCGIRYNRNTFDFVGELSVWDRSKQIMIIYKGIIWPQEQGHPQNLNEYSHGALYDQWCILLTWLICSPLELHYTDMFLTIQGCIFDQNHSNKQMEPIVAQCHSSN